MESEKYTQAIAQSSTHTLDLFSRRWHIRLLALLHEQNGARFVVMKNALGMNADSLTRSLEELIAAGWVQRNPGYGHPLRPEYLLTDDGRVLARYCSRFQQLVAELDVVPVVYRKWSVPALVGIDQGASRFNELRDRLQVTPRALSQSLDKLAGAELIIAREGYRTTAPGARIARGAAQIRRC